MAKVTWAYVEAEFYQRFARMAKPDQHGIITGLRAVMLSGTHGSAAEPEQENGELFEEAEDAAIPAQ
jgi:hypothetical protein